MNCLHYWKTNWRFILLLSILVFMFMIGTTLIIVGLITSNQNVKIGGIMSLAIAIIYSTVVCCCAAYHKQFSTEYNDL